MKMYLRNFSLAVALLSMLPSCAGAQTGQNFIVNPSMDFDLINQGAPSYPPPNPNSSAAFCVDRWNSENGTNALIQCQQSLDAPPGFTHSFKLSVSTGAPVWSGDGGVLIQQTLVAEDAAPFAFGTASPSNWCISFWVKANSAALSSGSNATFAIQNAPAGNPVPPNIRVVPTRSFVKSFPVTTSWANNSICAPGDTGGPWYAGFGSGNSASTGAYLVFNFEFPLNPVSYFPQTDNTWGASNADASTSHTMQLTATTGAWVEITGIKLEVGSSPTTLVPNTWGQELANVQLSSQRSNGNLLWNEWYSGTQQPYIYVPFNETMRCAPQVQIFSRTGTPNAIYNGVSGRDVGASIVQETSSYFLVQPNTSITTIPGLYLQLNWIARCGI